MITACLWPLPENDIMITSGQDGGCFKKKKKKTPIISIRLILGLAPYLKTIRTFL